MPGALVRRQAMRARRGVKRTRSGARKSTYGPGRYMSTGTNPNNHVSFRGTGFPDRLTTNLVYAESIILDPSVGTPTPVAVFSLNSLYDPNTAVGGGQPTYFDQLATVYSRYVVNGAKITATFSRGTTTGANIGPYLCGIQCSDLTSLPTTNVSALMSVPNTVSRLVSQEDGSTSIVQTYSKKNTYPDFTDNVQARINANPLIQWYAKVFASPQGIEIDTAINCTVVIEFNATFSDVFQQVDA